MEFVIFLQILNIINNDEIKFIRNLQRLIFLSIFTIFYNKYLPIKMICDI
jgi:hypothetical protein